MPLSDQPLRVGVMLNNIEGYARGVLRGVASYAFSRAWECHVYGVNFPGEVHSDRPNDGVIIQAWDVAALGRLRETGRPIVNVSSAIPEPGVPSVVCDDVAVGRLGADYFLRRGFRQFAFYSPLDRQFAKMRHEGFLVRLREVGHQAVSLRDRTGLTWALAELPKPLAVMACNDAAAIALLDQCRLTRVRVPDEVAVLGVDNDDLIGSLAFPPLSSVNTASERIGFEAGALLERLLRGESVEPGRRLIPPIGVVTRPSTDLVAVADADVAEALRFIRSRAGSPIGVEEVLRNVTVSRRQLERRFRDALGRSILDEIRRCRVERARQLLAETELTLAQVATASGFSTPSYFTVVFGEATGLTPGAFREQFRHHVTAAPAPSFVALSSGPD